MLAMLTCVLPILLIFAVGYLGDLRERRGDAVTNCDGKGQVFTYVVPRTEAEILQELDTGSAYTDVKYRWDAVRREITLHEGMPNGCPEVTFGLTFRSCPQGTAMRVSQLNHQRTVSGVPGREYRRGSNRYAWLQNEFWRQKLGAEPLRYQPDLW